MKYEYSTKTFIALKINQIFNQFIKNFFLYSDNKIFKWNIIEKNSYFIFKWN